LLSCDLVLASTEIPDAMVSKIKKSTTLPRKMRGKLAPEEQISAAN
jgi:hypothetical protein